MPGASGPQRNTSRGAAGPPRRQLGAAVSASPRLQPGGEAQQRSFRQWAWSVADDVVALRRDLEELRVAVSAGAGKPPPQGEPVAHLALSTSTSPTRHIHSQQTYQSLDEVVGALRDEHRALRCALEAEHALLRQEVEGLHGQVHHDPTTPRGSQRLEAVEIGVLGLERELLGHAEVHGALEAMVKRLRQQLQEMQEAHSKRLQYLEQVASGGGLSDLVSQSKLGEPLSATDSGTGERLLRLEELSGGLAEQLARLDGAQQSAEGSMARMQLALSAEAQNVRGVGEDLARLVEDVEVIRLAASRRELHSVAESTALMTPSAVASVPAPLDRSEALRAALRANPRLQPSEAGRIFGAFRAWAEEVHRAAPRPRSMPPAAASSGFSAAASPPPSQIFTEASPLPATLAAGGGGGAGGEAVRQLAPLVSAEATRQLAPMVEGLRQQMVWAEQHMLLEARSEVLQQHEELRQGVYLELQEALARQQLQRQHQPEWRAAMQGLRQVTEETRSCSATAAAAEQEAALAVASVAERLGVLQGEVAATLGLRDHVRASEQAGLLAAEQIEELRSEARACLAAGQSAQLLHGEVASALELRDQVHVSEARGLLAAEEIEALGEETRACLREGEASQAAAGLSSQRLEAAELEAVVGLSERLDAVELEALATAERCEEALRLSVARGLDEEVQLRQELAPALVLASLEEGEAGLEARMDLLTEALAEEFSECGQQVLWAAEEAAQAEGAVEEAWQTFEGEREVVRLMSERCEIVQGKLTSVFELFDKLREPTTGNLRVSEQVQCLHEEVEALRAQVREASRSHAASVAVTQPFRDSPKGSCSSERSGLGHLASCEDLALTPRPSSPRPCTPRPAAAPMASSASVELLERQFSMLAEQVGEAFQEIQASKEDLAGCAREGEALGEGLREAGEAQEGQSEELESLTEAVAGWHGALSSEASRLSGLLEALQAEHHAAALRGRSVEAEEAELQAERRAAAASEVEGLRAELAGVAASCGRAREEHAAGVAGLREQLAELEEAVAGAATRPQSVDTSVVTLRDHSPDESVTQRPATPSPSQGRHLHPRARAARRGVPDAESRSGGPASPARGAGAAAGPLPTAQVETTDSSPPEFQLRLEARTQELQQELRGAVADWRAGVAELRGALCSAWESEAQAAAEVEEEPREASLPRLRSFVSTELQQAHLRLEEELGAHASAIAARLASGERQAALELDAMRGQLAEAVGDGVELRMQVLALCDRESLSSSRRRARDVAGEGASQTLPLLSGREEGLGIEALRARIDRAEASQKEAIGSVDEVAHRLRRVQADVERLGAKVDAGEQNAARGLALLQQAITTLQAEHADLRSTLTMTSTVRH